MMRNPEDDDSPDPYPVPVPQPPSTPHYKDPESGGWGDPVPPVN